MMENFDSGGFASKQTALAARLDLQPLGGIDDAPPTLSFDRVRTIDLPWRTLVEESGTSREQATQRMSKELRSFVETGWGFSEPPNAAEIRELFTQNRLTGPIHRTLEAAADGADLTEEQLEENRYRSPVSFEPHHSLSGSAFPDGVFVALDDDRFYRLLFDQEAGSLTVDDFRPDTYDEGWLQVIGAEVVMRGTADVNRIAQTTLEHLDLRAPFIERRYQHLVVQRRLADEVAIAAKKMFDAALTAVVDAPSRIDELKLPYVRAELELEEIDRELRRLAVQAADMGYILHVKPLHPLNGDGTEIEPAKIPTGDLIKQPKPDAPGEYVEVADSTVFEWGRLYRQTTETRQWTPQQVEYRGWWIFKKKQKDLVDDKPQDYEAAVHRLVETEENPHLAYIASMRENGDEVYVFELRGDDYIADDGTPLEAVMLRCGADEDFRESCVLFLPDYELSLLGSKLLTGYTVIRAPMPGRSPIGFPELEVIEELTYKMAWLRSEVGELVRSINLAPGERREITITRSFQRETTSSTTTTSVFDLTSSETTDLATEMEQTARHESTVVHKVGAKATAKHSWGAGSVEGSASYNLDSTVQDVGTEMAKSAQNAARSMNEQRRQEVSSTTTMSSTTSTTDTSVSVIENINQGRTLNLMFYRVYNRFEGMLLLDDLHLRVRSGTELISGTGIRAIRTYSIRELDDAIAELATTPLPIADDSGEHFARFKLRILDRLARLVREEYLQYSDAAAVSELVAPSALVLGAGVDESTPHAAESTVPSEDVDALAQQLDVLTSAIGRFTGDAGPTDHAGDNAEEQPATNENALKQHTAGAMGEYDKKLRDLKALLRPLRFGSIPVVPSEILTAAKGLYLDSHVGSRPSTEPYSERMREAEIEMRHAEIERVRSEVLRNQAVARHLSTAGSTATGLPQILDIVSNGTELTLALSHPVGPGPWSLNREGRTVALLSEVSIGSVVIVHRFAAAPDWLSGDLSSLTLVNDRTGDRIEYDSRITTA